MLTLVALLVVSAGAGAAAEVQDMIGRRVAAPPVARRIVSLAPSLTEIMFALGAGEDLVGVTQFCDYPPAATAKPKIGGIYTPNFEAILSLRPDLILATTEGNREEHISGLERLGVPVYVVRPTDFASVLVSVERVGGLLGRRAGAAALVAAMRGAADAVARAVADRPRPRVLYVLWGNPLIVPGRDTLITDLIRRAGGDSVTGDEPLAYPRFSLEAALSRQPERVIVAGADHVPVDQRLREWEALGLLPAVRQGRVDGVDANLLHRPGPRIVEGLRVLARAIHPEVAW
jgi:iron complex transport system substrate-binding protein